MALCVLPSAALVCGRACRMSTVAAVSEACVGVT